MTTTKTAQREIVKDIRRQLVWIEQAIKDGDQELVDALASQLGATAFLLNTDQI
jgi:hypothetical protein